MRPMTGHNDSLQTLLDLQASFVEALDEANGKATFGDRTVTSREFLLIILGCYSELSEVIERIVDETKPWKQREREISIEDEIFEELIDVLFFLLEAFLFIERDGSAIFEKYSFKWYRNFARIVER